MLVITRKPRQALRIGEARVLVTRVSGNQVRLGFKTPPGVRAYREEVYATIRRANLSARIQAPPILPDDLTTHEPSND